MVPLFSRGARFKPRVVTITLDIRAGDGGGVQGAGRGRGDPPLLLPETRRPPQVLTFPSGCVVVGIWGFMVAAQS